MQAINGARLTILGGVLDQMGYEVARAATRSGTSQMTEGNPISGRR